MDLTDDSTQGNIDLAVGNPVLLTNAKGLGGYNQGVGQFTRGPGNSWIDLLINQTNRGSRQDKAMLYAMDIMHDANKLNLPYRRYKFQGGTGVDVNGDGSVADIVDDLSTPQNEEVIETTVPWCFDYGEEDWKNPFNVPVRGGGSRRAEFNDYQNRARTNPIHRANC